MWIRRTDRIFEQEKELKSASEPTGRGSATPLSPSKAMALAFVIFRLPSLRDLDLVRMVADFLDEPEHEERGSCLRDRALLDLLRLFPRIAAGSVVLKPVPARCTVAGVPARPVGGPCAKPSKSMDQTIEDPDA